MDKIVIHFEPVLGDYTQAVRSFLTRKRSYWVALGVYGMGTLVLSAVSFASLWVESFRSTIYLVFVFLIFFVFTSYPLWGGWLMTRNASRREQLTLPVKLELDEEKVVVVNMISEAKYDWRAFDAAYSDRHYLMLNFSANKHMFHFIPKRAFPSVEVEQQTRELIIRRLGKINDIEEQFTGWKLAGLSAVLFCVSMIFMLVFVLLKAGSIR